MLIFFQFPVVYSNEFDDATKFSGFILESTLVDKNKLAHCVKSYNFVDMLAFEKILLNKKNNT